MPESRVASALLMKPPVPASVPKPESWALLIRGPAQDSDVAPGEERGDGSLGVRPELVIAQAAVNSEGCLQLRDHLHHRILSPGIPGDEVACDGDEVGVKLIGERDVSANFVGGHERTDVKVGKLRDAESLKAFRQARQVNAPLGDLEIRAAVERAVGPRHKRNGGAEERQGRAR